MRCNQAIRKLEKDPRTYITDEIYSNLGRQSVRKEETKSRTFPREFRVSWIHSDINCRRHRSCLFLLMDVCTQTDPSSPMDQLLHFQTQHLRVNSVMLSRPKLQGTCVPSRCIIAVFVKFQRFPLTTIQNLPQSLEGECWTHCRNRLHQQLQKSRSHGTTGRLCEELKQVPPCSWAHGVETHDTIAQPVIIPAFLLQLYLLTVSTPLSFTTAIPQQSSEPGGVCTASPPGEEVCDLQLTT